jgi:hypothetical protein
MEDLLTKAILIRKDKLGHLVNLPLKSRELSYILSPEGENTSRCVFGWLTAQFI